MSYNERKIKITPKSVALIKENLLNDIAEILYLNGNVTTKFTFSIDYDETRWRRYEKSILDPTATKIKGVLKVTGNTPVSGDYLQYTEYYTTAFISAYKHRDDLEVIFREYQAYESTDGRIDVSIIEGTKYTITKTVDGAIMPNKADASDGSAEDKAYYYLSDNWQYSTYILNSEDLVLTINNQPINYLSIIHDVNKETLPSKDRTRLGSYIPASVMTTNNLSIVLPLLSTNLIHKSLFRDARDKKLINKTYNIKIEVDGDVIFDEEMELNYSSFTDTKTNPLVFSLMFTSVGPTQKIQIKRADDEIFQSVDYVEFRLEKVVTGPQDPSVLTDLTVKTLPVITSRNLYMVIPLSEGREVTQDIEADLELELYSDNAAALYDIKITKHNITFTYEMVLTNAVMHYTDSADEFLSLNFTDRRDL